MSYSSLSKLLKETMKYVIGLRERLDAVEKEVCDLRAKVYGSAGKDAPHESTWYTIPDYCEHKDIALDIRVLKSIERQAKKISEDLEIEVLELDGLKAYLEDVLDEVFGVWDDCEDEDDEDDDDDDCEDCLCYGCPYCPGE